MRLNRRDVLRGMAGGLVAVGAFPGMAWAERRTLFASCALDAGGDYVVAGFDQDGAVKFEQSLPGRGHGAALRRGTSECVVFARRPGTFAGVLDGESGAVSHWIESESGRHFYGHGAFSADGGTLFTCENDYDAARGVLGVHDAADRYKRIGEIPSYGIGPHEVRLMPDRRTLAVCNGGIRTHPDQPRAKLNLDTMAPSLAFVDSRNGALLGEARLPERFSKLSIRHMDIDRAGRVAVAMQHEGDRRDLLPLVGLCGKRNEIRLLHAPEPVVERMQHYTGSIAFDSAGDVVAATSPRGHVVTFWDAQTGGYLCQVEATDAAGIAPTDAPGTFLIAGGDGAIRLADARSGDSRLLVAPNGQIRWDNHICALG